MKNKGYLFLIGIILVIGLVPMSLMVSGETTPPTVNITSHVTDQTVSGTIIITATASDSGSGIQYLHFYFGGESISTDYSSPYSSDSIEVHDFKQGPQTITVVAFDNDWNYAVDTVIVNVLITNYDWVEVIEDEPVSDSHWWYYLWMDNLGFYVIDSQIRKMTFDAYSPNSNADFWWTIGCIRGGAMWFESDDMDQPSSNPTHITVIFGPDELPDIWGLYSDLALWIYLDKYGNNKCEVTQSIYYH